MSMPRDQVVRGHISARGPVDTLVGERVPLPLEHGAMECWSGYQLGVRGHVSARRPVEELVDKRVPLPLRLWAM